MSVADMSSLYTSGEYANKNPSWHVEDSPWKAQQIVRAINMLPRLPQTVCDIGCGAGEILRQLELQLPSETGIQFVGYDISPQALALARARQSLRTEFVLGDARADDRHFDLCLCIDVFEHVEDCFGFLRDIRRKADYFIFHIPIDLNCESLLRNFVMQNRQLWGHVHYFTRDTALALLRECGYTTLGQFYVPMPAGLRTAITTRIRGMIFRVLPNLSPILLNGFHVMAIASTGSDAVDLRPASDAPGVS